jgi:hypothetical protein
MNATEKQLLDSFKKLMLQVTQFDRMFLNDEVPLSKAINHSKWQEYLAGIGNKPGMRILEIGSREVTGKSVMRSRFDKATYIGFDIYAANNVDVVGDVHRLSEYFGKEERFDVIFSSACFEHFAMPWIASMEIAKLLKIGGLVFVETHFCFSSHERPWHFFHCTDMGLKSLFPPALGFECIEAGMSNPLVGRFSTFADDYLKHNFIGGMYCHSEYFGKKIADVPDFDWRNVSLDDVAGDTAYPKPSPMPPDSIDGKERL